MKWVSKVTVAEIYKIQQESSAGVAASTRELVGAFRLFDAIELVLQGERDKGLALAARVDPTTWGAVETILRVVQNQTYRNVEDPFSRTCLAAFKQLKDVEMLTAGADVETLTKIRERHEVYRLAQVRDVHA